MTSKSAKYPRPSSGRRSEAGRGMPATGTKNRRQTKGMHQAAAAAAAVTQHEEARQKPTTSHVEANRANTDSHTSTPEASQPSQRTRCGKTRWSTIGTWLVVIAFMFLFASFVVVTTITLASLIRTLGRVGGLVLECWRGISTYVT